jgi:hypothetical protein
MQCWWIFDSETDYKYILEWFFFNLRLVDDRVRLLFLET